jgi:ABC-type transport system involved in cytochrome bd biosynthesis fused ATPase/permease subunit
LRSLRSQSVWWRRKRFCFRHGARKPAVWRPDASEEDWKRRRARATRTTLYANARGYETLLGERGARFRRPESTRRDCARVSSDPRILILDEATAPSTAKAKP